MASAAGCRKQSDYCGTFADCPFAAMPFAAIGTDPDLLGAPRGASLLRNVLAIVPSQNVVDEH